METYSIKCWAEDDRPREKLLAKGRKNLTTVELLAILLGSGTGKKSAIDLAHELFDLAHQDVARLHTLSIHKLRSIRGIGLAKATSLHAALELASRAATSSTINQQHISESIHAYQLLKPHLFHLDVEEFHLILLNRNNKVIEVRQLSKGGFAGTVADGKVIFKYAIDAKAQGIILAHNHPSGNKQPSFADKELTNRLIAFGQLIELPVLDHIIFTDNGYFSFADEGLI